MIGDPGRLEAPRDLRKLFQIHNIERVRRANRKRHTMHHDRILSPHTLQDFEGSATFNHEVLRDDLEPVQPRTILQDMRIMGTAQANAEAERCEI